MSGEEAKKTLEAVGGLLILMDVTCLHADDSEKSVIKELFYNYYKAVEVAKDAIDIMDNKLSIENKED